MEEATLPKLIEYPATPIQINESLQLLDSDIVNLLEGQRVERALFPSDIAHPALRWRQTPRDRKITNGIDAGEDVALYAKIAKAQGATEERMSKALRISPSTLADLTTALWKSTFSDERDRRAGAGANAQKRGQSVGRCWPS